MDKSFLLALIGGIIIAVAASLKMLFNGRVAGISGIIGGILNFHSGDISWRALFVLGMFLGGLLFRLLSPELLNYSIKADYTQILIAGLLVGFGTRLGSGCTSGHGVCGIPRLSTRSILATLIFMGTAMVTVYILGS